MEQVDVAKLDEPERRAKRSWVRTPPPECTLSTDDWIRIGRETLIREGIVAVKIDRLAKIAGVTRGGFYWRFKNREELLDALIKDWRDRNTTPMLRVLHSDAPPAKRMRDLSELYIEGRGFDEAYDGAVRAWATLSPQVAEIVRAVDTIRLEGFEALFRDAGFDADEAMIRARITYFHQVGYYAIGMKESAAERWALVDRYTAALFGRDMT